MPTPALVQLRKDLRNKHDSQWTKEGLKKQIIQVWAARTKRKDKEDPIKLEFENWLARPEIRARKCRKRVASDAWDAEVKANEWREAKWEHILCKASGARCSWQSFVCHDCHGVFLPYHVIAHCPTRLQCRTGKKIPSKKSIYSIILH